MTTPMFYTDKELATERTRTAVWSVRADLQGSAR